MDEQTPPAKPRLEFRRTRQAPSAPSAPSARSAGRKHVPVDDALSRMAGKVGERRRAQDEARGTRHHDEQTF